MTTTNEALREALDFAELCLRQGDSLGAQKSIQKAQALAQQAAPLDGIHSCSLHCERPACIKRQRDELRDELYARVGVSFEQQRTSLELNTAPQAAQPEQQAQGESDLEKAIDAFVADYEFDDGEALHVPSEFERLMIEDAIWGMLVDEAWDNAWGAHIKSLAEQSHREASAKKDAALDACIEALEVANSIIDDSLRPGAYRLIEAAITKARGARG